jgi:hypothetical protein
MSRFNLAVIVLLSNASLNDAFLHSRIANPTRFYQPIRVKSYLDSLSQQPKSEEGTSNIDEDPMPTMEQPLPPFKELTEQKEELPTEEFPTQELPTEELPNKINAADAIATVNIDLDQVEAETIVEIIQEEIKPQLEITSADKCDDEQISLIIADAAKSTLGVNTSRNYRTTKQTLRESRGKNEKRLSRSSYVKEKSSDKISDIMKKAEEQVKIVERDLEEKLVDLQKEFDNEVSQPASQPAFVFMVLKK